MSNVLPPKNRVRMFRVVRARFFLTGALVLCAVAIVGSLALTPAYLLTALPRATLANNLGDSQEYKAQEEEDRTTSSHIRVLLATLAPFVEQKAPVHAVISRIIELSPDGVSIATISYQAGESGEVSIVGSAPSREHVNEYREALVAEGTFESVSVPVAALVGASEGNFRMTITGAF